MSMLLLGAIAVGVAVLPLDAPVEIEFVFEFA